VVAINRQGRGYSMPPATFKSLSLPTAGAEVVPAAPYPQRVVLVGNGAGNVLVSDTINAFGLGVALPGSAVQLPAGVPIVLVLAPQQKLIAAGTAATTRVSVAASPAIPLRIPDLFVGSPGAQFRTYTMTTVGTGDPTLLVPAAAHPQRVTAFMANGIGTGFLTFESSDLQIAKAVVGSGYELATVTTIFVLAPNQTLYGSAAIASPGPIITLQYSPIEVDWAQGPTGIPSPGGQE
jgi:hypothetical protein